MVLSRAFIRIEHILFQFIHADIESLAPSSPFSNLRIPFPTSWTPFPARSCCPLDQQVGPQAILVSFLMQLTRPPEKCIGILVQRLYRQHDNLPWAFNKGVSWACRRAFHVNDKRLISESFVVYVHIDNFRSKQSEKSCGRPDIPW